MELKFCHWICKEDPQCTAFHYDLLNEGSLAENCKIWTSEGYSGDGNQDVICFSKQAEALED